MRGTLFVLLAAVLLGGCDEGGGYGEDADADADDVTTDDMGVEPEAIEDMDHERRCTTDEDCCSGHCNLETHTCQSGLI